MSLDLIIGPMFSGKTTELIRRLTKFASIGKKCLYLDWTMLVVTWIIPIVIWIIQVVIRIIVVVFFLIEIII